MDRQNGEHTECFKQRLEHSCPGRVKILKELISQDVPVNNGEALLYMSAYSKYQIALPSSKLFPRSFHDAMLEALVDRDMLDDLEQERIINWCRTTKKLYPLKTTGDGNCLLHAVSQAMWGMEDSNSWLRRLLYLNIAMDPGRQFNKRWLFNERVDFGASQVEFRLNTEEHNLEWEKVKKGTDDSESSHGLPYETLEAIHLYVAANTLRRAIIVLADTRARNVFNQEIQESHIGGIYLPLGVPPSHCHKSPLVLAYHRNHFAPLVFEKASDSDDLYQGVAIVSKDISMLPCRFLLPGEQNRVEQFLKEYLNVRTVVTNGIEIPVTVLNHTPLPEQVNLVDSYGQDCREIYQRILNPQPPPNVAVHPFQFQYQTNRQGQNVVNIIPAGGLNLPQDFGMANQLGPFMRQQELERCCTHGCVYLADPSLNGLCSKCFKDFTIQYAKQEEIKRKIEAGLLPELERPMYWGVQGPPVRHEPYEDISMVNENCQGGCGFFCSKNTYPFCHECYPKFVGTLNAQGHYQITTNPVAENEAAVGNSPHGLDPEFFSLMPDRCASPHCQFRCSKATAPYCHECYERNRPPVLAPPTAPPLSGPLVPNTGPLVPNIGPFGLKSGPFVSNASRLVQNPGNVHRTASQHGEDMEETQVVSLKDRNMRPFSQVKQLEQSTHAVASTSQMGAVYGDTDKVCKTQNCNKKAEIANNGYCDKCYELNYFPAHGRPIDFCQSKCSGTFCPNMAHTNGQCSNCFLNRPQPGLNIVQPPELKILNSESQSRSNSLPPSLRSLPAEHDEREEHRNSAPTALELQESKLAKYDHRKRICSTPGCQGLRDPGNTHDLCYQCNELANERNTPMWSPLDENQLEVSSPLEENQLEVSCTPVQLTKEQERELNPINLSSKDKVKCLYPACKNMIYPPRKLCSECTEDIEKAKSIKSRNLSRNLALQTSENGDIQRCKTAGCAFYAAPQFGGLCSSCHKGTTSSNRKHMTEVLQQTPKEVPKARPFTESLSRAQRCVQKGCERYGDPKQENRCSQHYLEAKARFPPDFTQEKLQELHKIQKASGAAQLGLSVHAGYQATRPPVHAQTTEGYADEFQNAYARVENSRKINKKCANFTLTGCDNFGNPANEGYCNSCAKNGKLFMRS
ncbi:tumor necrosis factor alpha-induced protein 3-like [Dreissena polymorpha]|uniref:ubiquitinyl hydrolase 1 n=1 Tax=Dreissena polymorpha TaxID=45954 RepID=A0A9D4HQ31_DREPO|nr:tumor necrosis factor alpha-induced protein 3-like [Dreissena polymorpha]XP_052242971.1 tumor necrosis factor alpha-induced protein 3-like [Dreissena polymorpha]KAH3727329.1 hypothetical protein DPMN_053261 [Dreissena polymorpha]